MVEDGILLGRLRPGQIISVLQKCEFTLGMRLHSAVFSSVAGTPAIMIAYDPKVAAFSRHAYHPAPIDPDADDFNMRAIVGAVGTLYSNMNPAKQMLNARTAELIKNTRADAIIAERLYRAES
jgi:polysaccharide pyruvyl transferase WcaK-like protein